MVAKAQSQFTILSKETLQAKPLREKVVLEAEAQVEVETVFI